MDNSQVKYLYRYIENYGFYGEVRVGCVRYNVVKETEKGYWISHISGKKGVKFVRKEGRKIYAHATIDDARTSFIKRKEAQIKILETQISKAQTALQTMVKINIGLIGEGGGYVFSKEV